MKKLIGIILISLLLSAGALFAVDAEITYVKGKVEVQRGSEWIALKPGDKVSKSEMISTGFQSEAKVKLMDSIMSLGPVTRITLEELSSGKTQDKVNVYLKTGSVRSQVNHTDSKRVNYQVHTAVAVASARGTLFTVYDTNELSVINGVVAFEPYVNPVVLEITVDSNVETEENADSLEAIEEISESEDTNDNNTETSGVLVKANQVAVIESDSNVVEQPVNTVVKTVTEVVSAVTTAAAKEAVQSATVATVPAVTVVNTTPDSVIEKNGTLKIDISIE